MADEIATDQVDLVSRGVPPGQTRRAEPMRPVIAAILALLLSTVGLAAQVDPGVARLAHSPTGGAVLGPFPMPSSCGPGDFDPRCAEVAALAAYVRRETEVARLSAEWSPNAKRLLATLRAAQRGFVAAVARNEIDRRRSDSADEMQAAAEGQGEAFVFLLRRTGSDSGRSVAIEPSEAEARLETTYAIVMGEPLMAGTVTRDGVRETQRAWKNYRAAFVGLMTALERPAAPVEAELASARTRDLEGLIAD